MSALDQKRFAALDREWTARFDFNAMCGVEQDEAAGGRSFMEIVAPFLIQLGEEERNDPARQAEAIRAIRMSDIRLVLHHALLGAHEELSPRRTGEIIADIGFSEAMAVVAWAIVRAIGPGDGDEAETGEVAEAGGKAAARPRGKSGAGRKAG